MSVSFKDSTGRVWHPVVTTRTICAVERETGVGLGEIGNALIHKQSIVVGMSLAWNACATEVKEHRISADDFADAFTNIDDLAEMLKVLAEALMLFTQSRAKPSTPASAAAGPGQTSTN